MPIFDKLKNLFFGRNAVSSSEEPTQLPREQDQVPLGNAEGSLAKFFDSQAAPPESRLEYAEKEGKERVGGFKSEVQHFPRGNVLRWERTTNT